MASRPDDPPRRAAQAFTLVELLVSITVLTVLVVFVSQMVNGTASIATSNRQHLDADDQARLVFDRMALDFGRMLKRQDVDYIFKNADALPQVGNDSFFFYSEAPGYFDNSTGTAATAEQSPVALVGYRINGANQAGPYQLSRLGKGLTWDESGGATPGGLVCLTPSSTPSLSPTPTPAPASTLAGHWPNTVGTAAGGYADGTDACYHVIGDQVCRLEICFLLKPVPASGGGVAPPAIYSVSPYRGTDAAHRAVNGLQDVRAIVVALAVLDRASRLLAPDLHLVPTALRDVTAADLSASPPVLMAKTWQDEIDSGHLAGDAQILPAAAAQVRVYQRYFYLDTN